MTDTMKSYKELKADAIQNLINENDALTLEDAKLKSELVEIRKKNEELEKQVQFEMEQKAKAREQRDKVTKSLVIRDIEQQAKGIVDALSVEGSWVLNPKDKVSHIKHHKNMLKLKAKQLKEQG